MAATINDFLQANRHYAQEINEPVETCLTLALAGTGGIWFDDPQDPQVSTQELIERIAVGDDYSHETEAKLRRWLQRLIRQERLLESFMVIGMVRYIEHRLVEFAEDSSRSARQTREDVERHREDMKDPQLAAEQVARINRILPPEVPRVSVNDLEDLDRKMEERYGKPPTLEQLQQAQDRLQAWRRIMIPILDL